jgi:hypothetical protein
MAENALAKKLLIKPGQHILILNAPPSYITQLGELLSDTVLSQKAEGQFDLVQVFAYSQAELEQFAPQAFQSLKKDALFWISYPKVSSRAYVDLNRDKGWEAITSAGFEGVSLISIDETWSAMRFKPVKGGTGSRPKSVVSKTEERTVIVPDDFRQALEKNEVAGEIFDKFAYSHRKEYVQWIEDAKRQETRRNRIEKAVERIAEGIKFS